MSDLISRDTAQAEINKCHITSGVTHQGVWNECVDSISRTIDYIPSADIMECARALKEHCNEHLRKPYSLCDDCPMFERVCRRFNVVPRRWDLPEGERDLKNKG